MTAGLALGVVLECTNLAAEVCSLVGEILELRGECMRSEVVLLDID